MKLKRLLCAALVLFMAVPCAAGCDGQPAETVSFTDVWAESLVKTFTVGESYTLNLNVSLSDRNYLLFDFASSCGLDSTMYFAKEGDASETFEERFYLGAGETEFRQIVDYYHENQYDRVLTKVEFRCVGKEGGAFELKRIAAAKHSIDFSTVNFFNTDVLESNMQLFIQGETVKLGVTLKSGGAINWLSSINQGIGLSVENDRVYVGDTVKGVSYVADDVNLINAHDTGRLIQQSFYGTKGDSIDPPQDDYECGYFDHDGDPSTENIAWPYNPVQGGDKYQNFSRLIDVQVSDGEIYVKSRPMDWAKNGSLTPFYMENTYRIVTHPIYGEYVEVDNRMTDFSGYVHNNIRDQELPAFYGITPLGRLASYTGYSPWTGAIYSVKENLEFWSPGTMDNRFRASENWIAWLNEGNWGVGLFVPNVESMLVGRAGYTDRFTDLGINPYLANACTYTAPLGVFSMPNYDAFTYTYYLKIDYIEYVRDLFEDLHEGGASNPDIVALQSHT